MLSEYLRDAEILIVDDEPSNVSLLTQLFARANLGRVIGITDPREALQLCLWTEPDLILLDLHMSEMNGIAVLEELRSQLSEAGVPVIMMTGDDSPTVMDEAFSAGARDFLLKPFRPREVVFRVRNQLEIRFLRREIEKRAEQLERTVQDRTRTLQREQIETLERLARAAEYRDDDTGEHAQRVGRLSARIADVLGLPAQEVELIGRAATLHDVGKIGVSDTILLKPGKLTDAEMAVMRTHTLIGAAILTGAQSPYVQIAERIALSHHERWDGRGYHGLSGDEIPLEGRIVAIADVFDALTHERPYKEAWPLQRALDLITEERGKHFDPAVVDAFLQVLERDGLLPQDPRSEPAPYVAAVAASAT